MPGSWGLSGHTRKIAEAEYYYSGKDLDIELIKINSSNAKEVEEKIAALELDEKISELEKQVRENTMTRAQCDKEIANLKNEPYVTVIDFGVDSDSVAKGYIELDWNDKFVEMLHANGIKGVSDEDVVNKWFNSICRTVLFQEAADMDFGFEESGENNDVITKTEFERKIKRSSD